MSELLPCPFCGGTSIHVERVSDLGSYICCYDCLSSFWQQEACCEEDNVEAWNRRADGWTPIKTRPLTEEEKESHPDWSYILDCELPDNGQRILIHCVYGGHESVQLDEYYDDCGESYLDSGYDLYDEVDAWMPLPEPPKEGE